LNNLKIQAHTSQYWTFVLYVYSDI